MGVGILLSAILMRFFVAYAKAIIKAYAFLEYFLSKCSTENVYDSISETIVYSPVFEARYLGDTEQFLCIP